ncbi:anacyclamide/piricyclamide family prenylated cyclic peptide [Planktothrix agardhii]|uniref:anacyclamide/piricyclamide family prenylated cyclic peptide n=1 Tax=Planktothrix agardhii TaxID=1160 RepID=UPI001D0B25A6|nr:anacyclamide/piricyclamide family prenylated cyclic peptide [Planktothrix agardhii]MCB8787414.1 DUF5840 family protein [Planktothrix agardhii 1025]MCF3610813.1 DUF5840 family protein [Planktothrix agardhii 1027]
MDITLLRATMRSNPFDSNTHLKKCQKSFSVSLGARLASMKPQQAAPVQREISTTSSMGRDGAIAPSAPWDDILKSWW